MTARLHHGQQHGQHQSLPHRQRPGLQRTLLALCIGAGLAGSVWAKLPPLSDEAKAKAAEAAAKTAHGNKVADYKLCLAMNDVAAKYQAKAKAAGKPASAPVDTPPCADPGPFVPPAAATAAAPGAAAPAVAAAPAAAPAKK